MKKARSDSKLKLLSPERQEQIIGWANTPKSETGMGGLDYARKQLAADGIKVARSTVGEFVSWWDLQQRFARASSRAEQVLDLAKQQSLASPKELQDFAESVFTLEAVESKDADTYVNLQHLRLKRNSAETKADHEERKIAISQEKLRQADRRIQLLEANAASAKEKLNAVKSKGGLTKETLREIEEAAKFL